MRTDKYTIGNYGDYSFMEASSWRYIECDNYDKDLDEVAEALSRIDGYTDAEVEGSNEYRDDFVVCAKDETDAEKVAANIVMDRLKGHLQAKLEIEVSRSNRGKTNEHFIIVAKLDEHTIAKYGFVSDGLPPEE